MGTYCQQLALPSNHKYGIQISIISVGSWNICSENEDEYLYLNLDYKVA